MIRAAIIRWAVFAGACCCWEAAARIAADAYFPPPTQIVDRMIELWFRGPASRAFLTSEAIDNLVPSLIRMFTGLALACTAGITLGVAVGRSRRAHAYLNPLLQFGRSVPPPTLVPIFVVLFSIGTRMQVAAISLSGLWPLLLNSADGARATDSLQLDTARVYHLTGPQRLWLVILPASLPKIFAGLRISLSLALILMVYSELLPGASNGLGYTIVNAQSSSDMTAMWAGIVLIGIWGYLLNTVLLLIERRMLSWHRAARTG